MSVDPSRPFGPGSGEPPGPAPAEPDDDAEEARQARIANRFDIRRLIGALFLVYGVVLVITGLVGTHHVKTKADGINIDLWTGLGMLLFAAVMLLWAFTRKVAPEPPETRGQGSGRIRRAPAT